MDNNKNCYTCVHRKTIPGDAHSKCDHPEALISLIMPEITSIRVKGKLHGIKNGWFSWPLNFDPTWMEDCNSYKEKIKNEDSTKIV